MKLNLTERWWPWLLTTMEFWTHIFNFELLSLVGRSAATSYKWISGYEAQIEIKTGIMATNYNVILDIYIRCWTLIVGWQDSSYKLQIDFKRKLLTTQELFTLITNLECKLDLQVNCSFCITFFKFFRDSKILLRFLIKVLIILQCWLMF